MFGFEPDVPSGEPEEPEPQPNLLTHRRATMVEEFTQAVEQGLAGMLQDKPDVPAIAVVYLHEDGEHSYHPHVFGLASNPETLALLGYLGTKALDDYVGDILIPDEDE